MAVKIAYNNTPSLVLLWGNRVKLEPAGMKGDHAELTAQQQEDAAVVNMCAAGKVSLLSMDEATKRESRRAKAAVPSAPPRMAVENPATPPPAPEAAPPESGEAKKPEPAENTGEDTKKAPATKTESKPESTEKPKAEKTESTEFSSELSAKKVGEKDDASADDAKSRGKKSGKKSRRG